VILAPEGVADVARLQVVVLSAQESILQTQQETRMLKSKLIHPEILQALAGSGHFSQVLIADGNYPIVSGTNPATKRVFLNLAPGTVSALEVLEAVLSAIVHCCVGWTFLPIHHAKHVV